MIIINKNLQNGKNNYFINVENFPNLFKFDKDSQTWEQIANFYIFFNGVDFEVETTLTDSKKIFESIKSYMQKRKTLMRQAIQTAQDEIKAINKILKGKSWTTKHKKHL